MPGRGRPSAFDDAALVPPLASEQRSRPGRKTLHRAKVRVFWNCRRVGGRLQYCRGRHNRAHPVRERAQNGCTSSRAARAGRTASMPRPPRILSATALARGPVSPIGPTQPGHPFSQPHSSMSCRVRINRWVCILNNGALKPIPPG